MPKNPEMHLIQPSVEISSATKKLVPRTVSFASFCYSQQFSLFFKNSAVDSQSEVQQAYPLGSLLFSLATYDGEQLLMYAMKRNIQFTHPSSHLTMRPRKDLNGLC